MSRPVTMTPLYKNEEKDRYHTIFHDILTVYERYLLVIVDDDDEEFEEYYGSTISEVSNIFLVCIGVRSACWLGEIPPAVLESIKEIFAKYNLDHVKINSFADSRLKHTIFRNSRIVSDEAVEKMMNETATHVEIGQALGYVDPIDIKAPGVKDDHDHYYAIHWFMGEQLGEHFQAIGDYYINSETVFRTSIGRVFQQMDAWNEKFKQFHMQVKVEVEWD